MTRTRLSVVATLLCASAATAQQRNSAVRGTGSVSVIGQQTTVLGSFWPGLAATGGFTVRLLPIVSLRAEGEAAAFFSGGSAQADCIAGARCPDDKTPWGIVGGSSLIVLRHPSVPLYAGVGVGSWRALDVEDRMHAGPTYLGGLLISNRRGIALEGRLSRPSTAMGIVTSTTSLGLRFSP